MHIYTKGVRSLRTKTISYKGDHFVQKHRYHIVHVYKDFLYDVVPDTPRNHFVQRPFHTKETAKTQSQFCI